MLDLFPFNLLFVLLPLENFDVRNPRKARMSSWGSRDGASVTMISLPHLVSLGHTPVVSCKNCKGEEYYLKGLQGTYCKERRLQKQVDSDYQSWGLSADVLIYHISLKVSNLLEHLITARYFRGHGDTACDRYVNHLSIPCNFLALTTLILSIQPSGRLGGSVG